jgi:hypothetical protein
MGKGPTDRRESKMKKLAKDIVPGVDHLVLEDKTSVAITAVYPLGEDRWAIDTVGAGMVQVPADAELLVQSPA